MAEENRIPAGAVIDRFTIANQPSCFNCDSAGGGYYRPHEGETDWYCGHADGQGHYACANCKGLLFDANLFGTSRTDGVEASDSDTLRTRGNHDK